MHYLFCTRGTDSGDAPAWAGFIGDYIPSGLAFTPRRREKMCWMVDGGAESGASRHDRIRDAALEVSAVHGTSDATLQMIAEAAGVSVRLIQHHFGSKDGLIAAVDGHALAVVATTMSAPLPVSAAEAVIEVGRRVSFLIAERVSVVDYLARQPIASGPRIRFRRIPRRGSSDGGLGAS